MTSIIERVSSVIVRQASSAFSSGPRQLSTSRPRQLSTSGPRQLITSGPRQLNNSGPRQLGSSAPGGLRAVSQPYKPKEVEVAHTCGGDLREEDGQSLPMWSCNEWDPLKEVIVGRAEGQRVPHLSPDLKVCIN